MRKEAKVAIKTNTKWVAEDVLFACQKLKGVIGLYSLDQEQCKEKLRERVGAKV
ncbi:hypothetical protein [Candidatus Mycoplasma haematobovis]|uniref:hypothetical protein n=1 Tax=Candidatus Mycoplasma haematobovis TaxID=432608 RepID=UPI000B1122E7|nr:hypothetical protein [Candidatus Mycoplasma haematobovis]